MVKNPHANAGDIRDLGLIPGGEDPLEESMEPTVALLPEEPVDGGACWAAVPGSQSRNMTEATYCNSSGSEGTESSCHCRRCKRHGFNTCVRKIPWRKKWQLI